MSRIFLIPGLAANSNVYRNIKLSSHEIIYINWIDPKPQDTLTTYAQRIIDHYDIDENSIVIGNSLGGILAVEIAKKVAVKKVIITSTIKSHTEAPWYFYVFRKIPVYYIIPGKLYLTLGFWAKKIFYRLSEEDAKVYHEMFHSTSTKFLKWALKAILQWRNTDVSANLHHITGNNDIVFSYKRIKDAVIIDKGDHAMIYNRPDEMNKLINEIINK
ncbi:MAG: alpha/beta hydrolase [Mucilaginibacter sp.]